MSVLAAARGLRTRDRLQPTDLVIESGTLTALVGPNGSGKTSLLHALAGVPPASGSVEVASTPVHKQPPPLRQRLIGLLTADRHVAWPIAGRDLLLFGAARDTRWEPVAEALRLAPLLNRRVDRLSSGERARLLLGRLLASDPQLLLLDEPLANLDPYWQLVVMEVLRQRVGSRQQAVVLAIHDLATAVRFADRLILMSAGAVVWDGPAADLEGSGQADRVFGAEWDGARWQLSPEADRQSSP
jgi:iron complex transport system ATP-binding protein